MDNIILGLLLLQPRTIYQLRKRIGEGLNLMYSCSTGSIQAAIKKLLKNNLIYAQETTENGKRKLVYNITNDGKKQFELWINGFIDDSARKNPELTQIYFMGFAKKESRIKSLEKYIADMKIAYDGLQKICDEGEKLLTADSRNDILLFQLQTARYGRDLMKFNISWYTRLLNELRSK